MSLKLGDRVRFRPNRGTLQHRKLGDVADGTVIHFPYGPDHEATVRFLLPGGKTTQVTSKQARFEKL